MTAALVLPLSMMDSDIASDAPLRATETHVVEQRGIDTVLATERALGRDPRVQAYNNPGYDILSLPTDDGPSIRIEFKARLEGAEDFYVTHNEVITGMNTAPNYRLALVTISKTGAHDQVRYLSAPFSGVDFGDVAATGIRLNWTKLWHRGTEPFLAFKPLGSDSSLRPSIGCVRGRRACWLCDDRQPLSRSKKPGRDMPVWLRSSENQGGCGYRGGDYVAARYDRFPVPGSPPEAVLTLLLARDCLSRSKPARRPALPRLMLRPTSRFVARALSQRLAAACVPSAAVAARTRTNKGVLTDGSPMFCSSSVVSLSRRAPRFSAVLCS